jgi:beta-xylosidase
MRIWAPFVLEDAGVFYMFYTGVSFEFTQSIMLATSTNPADPFPWQRRGLIFQPAHPEMIWQTGTWANCRDPMVTKVGGAYYLYYTGSDQSGAILGIATATSPVGPWRDWGATVVSSDPGLMLESPTVTIHDGLYYVIYDAAGEQYRLGASPGGTWSAAMPFGRGWAHEIWVGHDGLLYTSFLTDYTVTISRLTWDTFFDPPRPFIGDAVYHSLLPLVLNTYP